MNFCKDHNNVANSRHSILCDELDLPKCQIASSGMCSEEMVQRLVNVSKNVDRSINNLNSLASYV